MPLNAFSKENKSNSVNTNGEKWQHLKMKPKALSDGEGGAMSAEITDGRDAAVALMFDRCDGF